MPLLILINTTLGRYALAALALLALLGGIYLSGAHSARQADTAAAATARINAMEQSNAAANSYRDDGALERLQRGAY